MNASRIRVARGATRSGLWIGTLVLATLGFAASSAAAQTAVYRIQLGSAPIGASRVVWRTHDGTRHSNAFVRINGMLIQRQRLDLDTAGLPTRYTLDATLQGHDTRIEVHREAQEIVETVYQAGHAHTTRVPCPQPIDWVDNNSFDTLQALLHHQRQRLDAGIAIPVFVPQAREIGVLEIRRTQLQRRRTRSGATREVLHLATTFSVAGRSVPLELDVDPASAALLRYRQPALDVTVTRIPSAMPVP